MKTIDKIQILQEKLGKQSQEVIKGWLDELERYESIKQLQENKFITELLEDLSVYIQEAEMELMTMEVLTEEDIKKRIQLQERKNAQLQLLQRFSMPDIKALEEEINKNYEENK